MAPRVPSCQVTTYKLSSWVVVGVSVRYLSVVMSVLVSVISSVNLIPLGPVLPLEQQDLSALEHLDESHNSRM